MKCAVVTVSDSCHAGNRVDASGPRRREIPQEKHWDVVHTEVLPDDANMILRALESLIYDSPAMAIFTTGGTGVAPRDVTPDATRRRLTREIPGLSELMRAAGMRHTLRAALSRGVVGIREQKLVVNLPGSPKAAVESLGIDFRFTRARGRVGEWPSCGPWLTDRVKLYFSHTGQVAQVVERGPEKAGVGGSTPSLATIFPSSPKLSTYAASAAVTSSSVIRSNSRSRASLREAALVLMEKAKQQVDGSIRHIGNLLNARAKTVIAREELRLARQVLFNRLADTGIEELGVGCRIEIAIEIRGIVQDLDIASRSGLPIDHG